MASFGIISAEPSSLAAKWALFHLGPGGEADEHGK
jgi:hypothetical protein